MIVNNEWGRMWKETVLAHLRHSPDICLEKRKLSRQDSWRRGRDSNQTPYKYSLEALPLEATFSVEEVSISVWGRDYCASKKN
jgi:hypothetical protein